MFVFLLAVAVKDVLLILVHFHALAWLRLQLFIFLIIFIHLVSAAPWHLTWLQVNIFFFHSSGFLKIYSTYNVTISRI